jgi:HEAT repeat protein
LTELQDLIFQPTRPPEELYDLEADPDETVNLLTSTMDDQRAYRDTANSLRLALYQWMIDSGDVGLISEPILEELGAAAGSKSLVRDPDRDSRLMWTMIETIEAGERGDVGGLTAALSHAHPAVRWWAATGLGNARRNQVDREALIPLLADDSAGVRVAAAQAVCRLGDTDTGLPILQQELVNENYAVGMYAIRGLEMLGEAARPARPSVEAALENPYELTRRIARRFAGTLAE